MIVNPAERHGPRRSSDKRTTHQSLHLGVLLPAMVVIFGLLALFLQAGSDEGLQRFPVPQIAVAGPGPGPVVDGRVNDPLTGPEPYFKFADMMDGGVDYGDMYTVTWGKSIYFAAVLNGPPNGGPVANENVYASCKDPGAPDTNLARMRGAITSVGTNTFTLENKHNGTVTVWTVNVDGSTSYPSAELAGFSDLAAGFSVEAKGSLAGTKLTATEVKYKKESYCTGSSDQTYHSTYSTGWSDGAHEFKKLLGSDRARFQISCGSTAVVHDFVQDYLRLSGGEWFSDTGGDGEVRVKGPAESASSLQWNLKNPGLTGWGDDAGENPLEQSPPFHATNLYPDTSPYPNFEYRMIYEFSVDLNQYDACQNDIIIGIQPFSGQTGPIQGMHNSPPKAGSGDVVITPTVVPSVTPTPTVPTNTPTDTPTDTATPTVPTNTPTDTPTDTATPTVPTNTPTDNHSTQRCRYRIGCQHSS